MNRSSAWPTIRFPRTVQMSDISEQLALFLVSQRPMVGVSAGEEGGNVYPFASGLPPVSIVVRAVAVR